MMEEIWERVKFILLEQGLAATPYLVAQCEANKGKFKTSVREYRLATEEDCLIALKKALDS